MPKQDLIGCRFYRWTVLAKAESIKNQTRYLCRCDCGTERTVAAGNLRKGASRSCGCTHCDKTTELWQWYINKEPVIDKRFIEFNGKRLTITQWAQELGIKRRTLAGRLERGWPVERALSL